jgi:hypothetical protein
MTFRYDALQSRAAGNPELYISMAGAVNDFIPLTNPASLRLGRSQGSKDAAANYVKFK